MLPLSLGTNKECTLKTRPFVVELTLFSFYLMNCGMWGMCKQVDNISAPGQGGGGLLLAGGVPRQQSGPIREHFLFIFIVRGTFSSLFFIKGI
jgi:hypothetical protein